MKKFFTFFLFLAYAAAAFAKPVSLQTAAQVAGYFYNTQATQGNHYKNGAEITLAFISSSKANSGNASLSTPVNYFYVFNAGQKNGFVIVAADDNIKPVLAYANEGEINSAKMPENVAKWLEGYKTDIRYVIENKIEAGETVKAAWDNYTSEKNAAKRETNSSVSPLLKTKWDQSPYYNALCPYDNNAGERTVTGCVATAMAQVMKFWSYPEQGSGFHSYNHDVYGTLTANFSSTSYNWSAMPNTVTGTNNDVATLMMNCGISVDMNYGIAKNGGSGAYVIKDQSPVTNCAEYALKNYFGYSDKLKGIQRDNYSDTDWEQLLKTELDNGRPIIYAGFGTGGGHCFVCDGYDNSDYFHFNWGWSGAYDGYFLSSVLEPLGVGTGGGNGGFNSSQQAIIGIQPPGNGGGTGTSTLVLYDEVTVDKSTINYGENFTVHTNIWNNGTKTFKGEYGAGIFDNTGAFVDFIETKTGIELPANYQYNGGLDFTTNGLLSALPGEYTISVFYKPTGGNWTIIDNGDYNNYATISIVNASTIELYSNIAVTPDVNNLVKGKQVTVKVDLANFGSTVYEGAYDVSLYNMDGSFAASIETKNNVSLCSNCHYQSPLTFTTNSLQAEPGTYLLAVLHKPTDGEWQLAGSTNYINPIKVIVKAPAIVPDKFEDNNSIAKAYILQPTFNGSAANFQTAGSSIHVGQDLDYYKIKLAAGYEYNITARVHDAENSNNGKTYTTDVLFSYSKDGNTWSDAFDAVMPGKIFVKDNADVYFLVSPYFQGATGTYLLDVNIQRTQNQNTGLQQNEIRAENISISPNPAKDFIQVSVSDEIKNVKTIKIIDIAGREMYNLQQPVMNDGINILPTEKLTDGVYFIVVQTEKGIWKNKFIKVK
ncbi:MAG: T9SS type A sorting domain-containing protein [Sphingobacteriales bacterium]|nr:MAG: T9SS type A sorting domain-containing protein [Sphingobacteriales bacterium]